MDPAGLIPTRHSSGWGAVLAATKIQGLVGLVVCGLAAHPPSLRRERMWGRWRWDAQEGRLRGLPWEQALVDAAAQLPSLSQMSQAM